MERTARRDQLAPGRRLSPAAWFAALDRAGPAPANEQLAALLGVHPDSIRRYRRRFGNVRPAELPADVVPDRRPVPARRRPGPASAGDLAPLPAELPAWAPASQPGRVVYGFDVRTGEPHEAAPASCFVVGLSGSGKSNTFAVILRQLGGRVYVVDGHAGAPGSLAARLGQPPAAHDQAGAVAIVAEARAELARRIEAARAGVPISAEPWTVAVDEFDQIATPAGPAAARLVADLLAIANQGRKLGVFALIGTQTVAGPLSAVPAALRAAAGLIVHQVGGRYVFDATGERAASLPANPARFAPGEALVRLPGHSAFAHVRLPLAPADGGPLSAPPLPVTDARQERRALAQARGVARERIDEAAAAVRELPGDQAAGLRGALAEAAKIAGRARSLAELRDELAPYWPDVEQAEALAPEPEARPAGSRSAVPAERRSWWGRFLDAVAPLPALDIGDQDQDQDDDDQDEPDRTTPRPLYVLAAPEPEPADVRAEALDQAWRRPHLGATMWYRRATWARPRTSAELLDAEAERERGAY